jgi:glycosyltransferase involved in cell wall biosynthesis
MNKPVCVIEAPILSRSGYGNMSDAYTLALIKQGKYDVKIVPTRWGACPSKYSKDQLITDDEKLLFEHILNQNLTKQPDLFIKMGLPTEYKPIGKYNIGVTAGIETTLPSPQFVEGMNTMNLNIVISEFVKKVFTAAKYQKKFNDGSNRVEDVIVKKPIETCFIGVDSNIFKKTDTISDEVNQIMNKISEDFCFLFVGMWTHGNGLYSDRKDIGNLIKTFLIAHKDKKNKPALVLKTSGATQSIMDRMECLKRIDAIKKEVGGDTPNVYLIHGDLTDTQMNELYNHPKIKININFSHGEGFGIPLLEASMTGKPIMVSNWSGHLDFLDEDTCTLLEGEIKPIQPESVNDWLVKESGWFYVSYSLAEEKIKNVNNSYKSMLEKAEKAMIRNREQFNINKMNEKFCSIIDKYVPEFAVEQKLILPKLKKIELPKLKKIE